MGSLNGTNGINEHMTCPLVRVGKEEDKSQICNLEINAVMQNFCYVDSKDQFTVEFLYCDWHYTDGKRG